MMKNIILLPLALLSIFFVGCDVESPLSKDLYPQKVYIVGSPDLIVDRDLNLGNITDTVTISVAVSGSRPTTKDVTATVGEQDSAVINYDYKNLSNLVTQYRKLDTAVYKYPSKSVIIKAGKVYNTFPIYIKTATFQCDSLYMLPLKLTSTSAYALTKTDTLALLRLNMVNKYSGSYYMYGVIRNTTNDNDTLVYKMSRTLLATDNGQTVRMYHYNNEYNQGDTQDYRPSFAFKITVNAKDNTLSFATWKNFGIIDGGGTYNSTLSLYNLWYTFKDSNGVIWKTVGYLYLTPTTAAGSHLISDFIDDNPLGK
jgi:hypothetical protein